MTLYEKILKYDNSKLNALYYVDKKVSFIQLLSNIRKLVTYFSKKGIKKGDIVTVVLPNIPSSIYTFYALDALGAIQNIIHPLTTFDKIIETMEQTGSNNVVLLATNYQDNEKYINESKYHFFFANPMYDNSLLLRHMFYFKFKKPKENSHIFLLDKFYKENWNIALSFIKQRDDYKYYDAIYQDIYQEYTENLLSWPALISVIGLLIILPFVNKDGKTIGKFIFKISVSDLDLETSNKLQIFMRKFFFVISIVTVLPLIVSFLLSLFNKDGRTIHDYLSKTRLIDSKVKKILLDKRKKEEELDEEKLVF